MGDKRKVVVVIDEEDTNTIYLQKLEKAGFDVLHFKKVSDGVSRLRELSGCEVLLVLDVMLPPEEYPGNGIDTGLLAYRDIRAEFPFLPIIVFTLRRDVTKPMLDSRDENVEVLNKLRTAPKDLLDATSRMIK